MDSRKELLYNSTGNRAAYILTAAIVGERQLEIQVNCIQRVSKQNGYPNTTSVWVSTQQPSRRKNNNQTARE